MNLNSTPRTDALAVEAETAGTTWPISARKFRDLCSELERENNRLRAELEALTNSANAYFWADGHANWMESRALQEQLNKAQEFLKSIKG